MKFIDLFSTYIVLPAAVLYFTGWMYLSAYCRGIGLDVALLDADINTIIMNSYHVVLFGFRTTFDLFAAAWGWIVLAAIIAAALTVAVRRHARWRKAALGYAKAWSERTAVLRQSLAGDIALLLVLGVALSFLSRFAAASDLAFLQKNTEARIVFEFTQRFVTESKAECAENDACYYPYLKKANDQSRLRLLLETPAIVVAWAQHGTGSPIGEVYVVKREDINFVATLDVEVCHPMEAKPCALNIP